MSQREKETAIALSVQMSAAESTAVVLFISELVAVQSSS